jgi:hypothetical protein
MFTDEEAFLEHLVDAIPSSVDMKEDVCPTVKKELEVMIRFEQWCIAHGLVYERHLTNSDGVNCFINSVPLPAQVLGINCFRQPLDICSGVP